MVFWPTKRYLAWFFRRREHRTISGSRKLWVNGLDEILNTGFLRIAAMTNLGSRLEAVPLRNRVKKSSGASQRIAGFRKSESCGDVPKQS